MFRSLCCVVLWSHIQIPILRIQYKFDKEKRGEKRLNPKCENVQQLNGFS